MTKTEAIKILNASDYFWLRPTENEFDALNMAIDALEQEEIIRCKDCKFNKGKYKCFNPKSVAIFPNDNDYCSYAERLESDE